MFNALGNIFSNAPRKAEQSDTRQAIQRHDPEYERRRKNKKPKEENDLVHGSATISVTALKVFLENFVKNSGESTETTAPQADNAADIKTQAETAPKEQEHAPEQHKKSAAAANAASSYQSAADTNEKSTILFETTDAAEGPSLDLSAADIRKIYTLIDDLKLLSQANIEYLNIERATSFLESLMNAVNKVKATL